MRALRPQWWLKAKPWHTNLALALIGFGMICFTRQLIAEYDQYVIGNAAVAAAQLILFVGAVLILLVKPSNVDRYTFTIIVGVAILCRLVTLYPDPFLSSDVYRYAWDGVVQHAHINPYRYVPGDPALRFLREPNADLFANMNRRDYAHTIYPPFAQMMFYCITFLSPTVTFMKTAMVLFEGVTMFTLVRLLRELGIRREWTIVYAWFPMVIWELAGSGHLDSIVMALLMLAALFRYRRQPVLTGVFLGLAVLTKFYPLVMFPAFYRRGDWKMPATMAGLAVACYAVYVSAGKMVFGFLGGYAKEEGLDSGARYFLLELGQHIPGLHNLSNGVYVVFAGLILGALSVWAWRTSCPDESARAAFLRPALGLGLALMLLFSPHYPWYVAWLLPFVVLVPTLTVATYLGGLFYLCSTALAVGYGPKQFELNEILYGTVAIVFAVEFCLRRLPGTRPWFSGLRWSE